MPARRAIAIRPYGERLRPKVFDFLAKMGAATSAPPQVGVAASVDEIVRHLATERADLLVVPFHVHRSSDGERTHGIELLAEVRRQVRWTRDTPVVMPVSLFVRVAFDATWRQTRPELVFPLFEKEIPSEATAAAFRRFLATGAVEEVSWPLETLAR